MVGNWTAQQVLELAPDAGSSKAAQGLAKPTNWETLGCSEEAVWGEIKGSGKKPYQVRIDLSEPAFKCSCPSRKFPCKHGLALFLVLAECPGKFAKAAPPAWVSDWIKERAARKEKRATRKRKPKEVDPKAQARRAEQREANVQRGVEELSSWLEDLVRNGLGAARTGEFEFWENAAARMIDAQAPGLARYVRQLEEIASSGEGWQERMLAGIGRLHLLLVAYRRIVDLPEDLRADIRTYVGWTTPREELLKLDPVEDRWCVIGQLTRREEQLRMQRTWLLGRKTGRMAMILQFAAGNQGFETTLALGSEFDGELVYYPSARPIRAIIAERADGGLIQDSLKAGLSIEESKLEFAQALAAQPWIEVWPVRLASVTPWPSGDEEACNWNLIDSTGHLMRFDPVADCGWQLLAISGGREIDLFGEWDGHRLRPMSASAGSRFFAVVQTEDGYTLARVA